MITLKYYQKEALEAIREGFNEEKRETSTIKLPDSSTIDVPSEMRQYIEMPTGSGKTITFLSYAKEVDLPTLIIVPSKELMAQVYQTALLFFPKEQISRKGDKINEGFRKILICIVHSIKGEYFNDLCAEEYDLIIVDECHHAYAKTYKKFLDNQWEFFAPKILGVTATPDRLDGKMIKDLFYKCTFKLEIGELIEKKQLCEIEGYSIKTKIDLSLVHDHNKDFSLKQLYKMLCTESRNRLIVNTCLSNMKDRKTLIFLINIEHSKIISQMLNDAGISSAHIDGTMNRKEKDAILSAFRKGEISCLCNCQLLTEGFDEPSIDGIILARPTKSRSLFIQMVGRGLRVCKGKENCKIIDIVDNHKNLIGFNSLVSDEYYPEMESFKSYDDLKKHKIKQQIQITEFRIKKTDLINSKLIDEMHSTQSQDKYLGDNNIFFEYPLSFDEASFLIWFNELKKEYANVNNT